MARNNFLLVLLLAASNLLAACSTKGWQVNINGTVNGQDFANAVAVNRTDDVVAAGVTQNTPARRDFTVVKLSGRDGKEVWRQVLYGTDTVSSSFNQATAVTMDNAGDVVAAGYITNKQTSEDIIVVKFDGVTGAEIWRQVFSGTANQCDITYSVAVDSFGNVVTAGYSYNSRPLADLTVIKFDGVNGTELWRHLVSDADQAATETPRVAVDARGDVLAVGSIRHGEAASQFAVLKFDGAKGTVRWQKLIRFGAARAVTVDLAGDVIGGGNLVNIGATPEFAVVKIDGVSGAELWRKVVHGTATVHDTENAHAVGVDVEGNVFAAGYVRNATTGHDFTVVKLDGVNGAEHWRQMINGTWNENDYAVAISVDRNGDVIGAGSTNNTPTGLDFTVVKFHGVSGRELWRRIINGTTGVVDIARAVTTDSAGNAVAVGQTQNIGTGSDFTVIKLTGTDGNNF